MPLERRDRPLGDRREARGPLAVVGRERLCGRLRRGGELGDVAEPLALGPEALLGVGLEPLGRGGERGKLLEAGGRRGGVPCDLVVAAAGGGELAPGDAGVTAAPGLRLAAEGVEHVELVGGAAEPALLELARHRDQPLRRGREILARDAAAPRVGARAPVREDAAREHEPLLVVGAQLGERLEALLVQQALRQVELGLDVRLAGARADVGGVALRAEQEPDRLREDRLPRAGLAGDRVQPGPELELGLADEHEILDPETAQHEEDGIPSGRSGHWL